jgi:hypothetical protein
MRAAATLFINSYSEDIATLKEIFGEFGEAIGLRTNLQKKMEVFLIRCNDIDLEQIMEASRYKQSLSHADT